jgi:hypothetical protein
MFKRYKILVQNLRILPNLITKYSLNLLHFIIKWLNNILAKNYFGHSF